MKTPSKDMQYLAVICMVVVLSVGLIGYISLTKSNFAFIDLGSQTYSDKLVPRGHITFKVIDPNGNIKAYIQSDNKIVDNGLKVTADQLFGNQLFPTSFTTTSNTLKYIGVGTGTNAPATGDTGLQIQRANKILGSVSTCAGICAQVQGTFAAGKLANATSTPAAITEAGLFDAMANSTSSSNMYARLTFAAINVATPDTLQATWQVTFSSVN